LILIFGRLQDFPTTLVSVKINEGLHYTFRQFGIVLWDFRQTIELVAVSIEDRFPSGQLVRDHLWNWHAHCRRVLSCPCGYTEGNQVLSQTFDSSAMPGASQNAFVWTKAAGSYAEVDQAPLRAWKPHQTCSSIWAAWWIVWIYETRICDVLGLGTASTIRITNEWRTIVLKMRCRAFVETRSEEAFNGLADGFAGCV
jgi:hypothetical protein